MQPLKHPRTLVEAFGPYADRGPIEDPVTDRGHIFVTVFCTALSLIFFGIVVGSAL